MTSKQSSNAFAVFFRDLRLWSVGSFYDLGWKWRKEYIKPLSVPLTRKKVEIDQKKYPFENLQLVSLHFDGTIEPRRLHGKNHFKGKLFFAYPGDVIYSKIDVRNGAIGVVPEKMDAIALSSEFPVYEVKSDVADAEYIKLVFRTKLFRKAINSMISGTSGRKRVQPSQIETMEIPIPPLEIQQAIVERWQNAQYEIKSAKRYAEELIQDTETDCLSKLGITVPPPTKLQGATSLNWRNLERWDTFFYRPDFLAIENQLASIQNAPLNEVLSFTSRRWNRTDFPDGSFKYIEISSVTKEEGITGSKTISTANPPSRATTLVRKGDVIISTTRPYLGAITVVPDEYDCCVCSSGFALADSVKNRAIEKDFVVFFLKTAAGLRQMERRMTGGLYPAIVQEELEKIRVPIPSQAIQRSILKQIMDAEKDIKQKRELAELKEKQTNVEIEALILGLKKLEGLE